MIRRVGWPKAVARHAKRSFMLGRLRFNLAIPLALALFFTLAGVLPAAASISPGGTMARACGSGSGNACPMSARAGCACCGKATALKPPKRNDDKSAKACHCSAKAPVSAPPKVTALKAVRDVPALVTPVTTRTEPSVPSSPCSPDLSALPRGPHPSPTGSRAPPTG